jgi:large repetitive protein
MSGTDVFGDIADLATALGVLKGGDINTAFFADPAATMGGTLRDATRRTALLQFLDDVLGDSAPQVHEATATWTPVFELTDKVHLYLVTAQVADGITVGIGVLGATSGTPGAQGRLSVPLALIPPSGPAVFLPGSGSADAVAEIAAQVDVGSASLQSVGLTAAIPIGPQAAGAFTVSVTGLRVPGSDTPLDLSLDSSFPIGPQLLHVIAILAETELQALAGNIEPEAAALLGLVGLAPDSVIPLPLGDLATRGLAALRDWLAQVAASQAALTAWFAHLAALAGATVTGPLAAALTLTSGVDLTLGLIVDTDSTGLPRFAPTVGLSAAFGQAAIELNATVVRASIGAHPSVTALPELECHARYGAGSGASTILDITQADPVTQADVVVQVGALRAGIALDANRLVFVLAADRVVLGPPGSPATHDVLDLTSPDALAELGGQALSGVLSNLIAGLGAPAGAVSELFGLTQPAAWSGGSWPVINAAALIADPVKAWLGFLGQVLALGPQAFADLLSSAATLLGQSAVAAAAGTQADPWLIARSGDLAVVAWTTTDSGVVTLHTGMRWPPAASQVGGADGPTISMRLVAEALAITLPAASAALGVHVLPAITLVSGLAAPAGHPVSMSLGAATVDVPVAEVSLAWTTASGLQASFGLPGATVTAGAVTTALALPSIDGSGNLVLPPGLNDQVLETLLAGMLTDANTPWLPPLVQALGLGQPGARGEAFSQLLSDPRGWVVARLRSLLSAADPAAVEESLGYLANVLAALAGTPSPPSLPAHVAAPSVVPAPAVVSGSGRPDDPLVVPLQAGEASVGLALWLEPDGPPIPPAVLTSLLQPTSLSDWLTGAGSALSTSDLARLLAAAGQRIPGLGQLVAGRGTLAAGWDALITRCAGGDGLLPGGAPDIAGATASTLAGIAHADLPAHLDLTSLAGLPAGARVLYVTGPFVPPWPDARIPTLDLTTPGLPDTAFDTSALAAAAGPWHVRLPFRTDCPGADPTTRAQACAARLTKAIAAAAAGGGSVLLVAHGPAAAGTARLAATGAPVAGLVLLGASDGAVPLDVLDQPPAADALALARRLLPDDASHDGADLAAARSVIGLLGELFDATHDPAVDLTPPAGLPALAVPAWSVRGSIDAASLTRAIGAVVGAGLAAFQPGTGAPGNPGAPGPAAPTALRAAVTMSLPLAAATTTGDPAGISLDVTATLDIGGFALSGGGIVPPPALALDIDVYRANGWLAGGPQGSAPAPGMLRTPALRRARMNVSAGLTSGTRGARATVTLVEGSALGVARDAWVLGSGGEQLGAESRVLIGRLAAALTPVPASGPVAALAGLLTALGLADPQTALPGFALSADAAQQLLVDPASALSGAFSTSAARLAAADSLRGLLGATGTGGNVQLSVGAFDISLDLAASPAALTMSTSGIALGSGPVLSGSARVDTSGAWSGAVSAAGAASFGSPGLDVQLGGSGVAPSVGLTFGTPPDGVPDRITLYPPPSAGQLAGIAQAALAAAGAAALRTLIAAMRAGLLSAAQRAKLDPVLSGLRLLTGTGDQAVPAVPFGIFTDPAGYLRHAIGWSAGTGPAADQAATLIDDFRALIGAGSAGHGVLPLSPSVTISAGAAAAGGLRIAIGYAGTEGQLTSTVDAGLTLAPGTAPVPHLDTTIGLAGHTADVSLALDGSALGVTLHTGGGDIALLPAGPGLGSLATTAVRQALPYVLDALHDHAADAVRAVLDTVREVLALGTPGFDGTQLKQVAGNPGAELVRRLVAYPQNPFTQLALILPTLQAPWAVSTTSSSLRVTYGAQWVEMRLAGSPPVLTVEVSITTDVPGITGASLSVDAVADTTGLQSFEASAQVAPASAIQIGPLTVAPVVEVSAGPAASPARVAVGLVVADGTGTRTALLSIALDPVTASLRTQTNGTDDPAADPAVVVTHVLVPLVADAALREAHVKALLNTSVGSMTLAQLLQNVVLTTTNEFDAKLLALDTPDLMTRLARLLANIAAAAPPFSLPDNLQLEFAAGGKLGLILTVTPGQRVDLIPGGDIGLAVEVDPSWVDPALPAPGLSVMMVDTTATPPFIPPVISMDGVGLRLYRRSGPLLDTAISVGSVGLFGLLKVDASGPGVTDGGLALQLADIAISPASAANGNNGVAQGILGDAKQSGGGGDPTPLKPTFSPELALQKRLGDPDFAWSLTAGPGNGPWLLPINRSFGPLRIDDVGFGDEVANRKVTSIRIIISGGLSLAGLNLDVQELSIGAPWPDSDGRPLTDATTWSLDLAGLAVSYSGGGVQLAGGLRRRDNPSLPGDPPDYIGVLLARIGPYGLTAFGGYGQFPSPGGKFTALFVFAAISAPIGGPPAFFVTGLGGGAGINRALVLPIELNDFATFPMVAALDPHSTLASDPEHAMDLLSSSFPPQRGTFWFAAGVSFTSFALVDVIAVVALEVGDGFAVTLLGLARAALPTTYLPLVQLELAMMAHFSTSEGVLEVRAQLTDNSYLLTRDCRLTGGFAYVSWFGPNPNAGQFVLSIGGYHPSFHRPDYPDVPRVGYRWDVLGCLTIIGESYFALTSEAIMAGTRFTAALNLGPLWASLALGVDAIVFFDPFHFLASGYASIAAGITIDIDLLFGHITVTLSFHLGGQVTVEGPDFHGSATIDLDVTSATIAFGGSTDTSTPPLGWNAFAQKYLTGGGGKPVLSAAVRDGGITPGGGTPTPDGSAANPWLLVPEFSFSVASTAAANSAAVTTGVSTPVPIDGAGWVTGAFAVNGTLAIAPMQAGGIQSRLGVSIVSGDGPIQLQPVFADDPAGGISVAMIAAPMPKGVWAAQLPSGAIPTGDTITAGTGLTVTVKATVTPGSPPINYSQVQPGPRQPLPFGVEETVRPELDPDAANAAAFATTADTANAGSVLDAAFGYLDSRRQQGLMTPLAAATFRRDRVAPPRLALLTDGIAPANVVPPTLTPIVPVVTPPLDTAVAPPVVTSFLAGGTLTLQRQVARTTIAGLAGSGEPGAEAVLGGGQTAAGTGGTAQAASVPRVPAPTLASVTAGLDPALAARLRFTPPLPQAAGVTADGGSGGLAATDGGPVTRRAGAPAEAHALPGLDSGTAALLAGHQAAFAGQGTTLRPGDVFVTTLPNHERDLDATGPRPAVSVTGDAGVRVVALSALGEVLADQTANQAEVEVPQHTARLAAWCVGGQAGAGLPGAAAAAAAGMAGWSATDLLPYVGAGVSLARDCVVAGLPAPRRSDRNAQAGHSLVAAPAAAAPVIRTVLPAGTSVVVVSLDTTEAADLSGLTVGIDGAARASTGTPGALAVPVVVAARGRTHLLYDLAGGAPAAGQPGPVTVSVGTSPSWRLAGVMGGIGTAATTAPLLAASGAAHLLAPLLQAPTGSAQLNWSAPPSPGPPGPALAAAGEPADAAGPADARKEVG